MPLEVLPRGKMGPSPSSVLLSLTHLLRSPCSDPIPAYVLEWSHQGASHILPLHMPKAFICAFLP